MNTHIKTCSLIKDTPTFITFKNLVWTLRSLVFVQVWDLFNLMLSVIVYVSSRSITNTLAIIGGGALT